jgi:hypothetical protein
VFLTALELMRCQRIARLNKVISSRGERKAARSRKLLVKNDIPVLSAYPTGDGL